MTPKKRRRLAFAVAIVAAGAGAAWLILGALKENIVYFRSPSDVVAKCCMPGQIFRIGGLVGDKSVVRGPGAAVHFTVTDGKGTLPVAFHGVLPALFREGQGIVAVGALDEKGQFVASEVLAKHDEKYMPPEVVDALKRSGRWKEGEL